MVKKPEQTVPKVKIKEPKKEEKKKEMKPEVAKPPTAPPVPTTTVTVTTENKPYTVPYLVTDDKGHQVVAYFDQNSVSLGWETEFAILRKLPYDRRFNQQSKYLKPCESIAKSGQGLDGQRKTI